MRRRKNIKTKSEKGVSGELKKKEKNLRFEVSLVFLIAGLLAATLLLLISVNNHLSIRVKSEQPSAEVVSKAQAKNKTSQVAADLNLLENVSLDFQLTIPPQLSGWIYKTGYVKSLVDDNLSDQYLQIYFPSPEKTASKNFEERYVNILTIKKYASSEWKELEKGCQNDNRILCELAGSKLIEKGDKVYSFTKSTDCPGSLKSKCNLAEKIVGSFKLK